MPGTKKSERVMRRKVKKDVTETKGIEATVEEKPDDSEPGFQVPTKADNRGVAQPCLTVEHLMEWKFNQASILGTQEGITRREVQAEFLQVQTAQQVAQLTQEARMLRNNLHEIADDDKRWKNKLSELYGVNFRAPNVAVNLDTGIIKVLRENRPDDAAKNR